MFDLDDAITEWRQEMRAAGIKSPLLLDELENHLRDEVDRRIGLGSGVPHAFEAAVLQMGRAGQISTEFRSALSNIGNPDEIMKLRIRNILVILAMLATGMGLILPALAKWRAHETLAAFDITVLLIGMAAVACGLFFGARGALGLRKA